MVKTRDELAAAARPGPIGRATDTVIREIFPGWASRRRSARVSMALADGYDVTRRGRGRRNTVHTGGSADRHLDTQTLFKVREITRAADRNSPLLHGIIERWTDNVVGPDFGFEPTTEDDKLNDDIAAYVQSRMGKMCDIRRKFNFGRLVRTWTRSLATDGDILPVFTEDGLATYEADQLVSPRDRQSVADRKIVNGVHVDPATWRDLGYYVAGRSYQGYYSGSDWTKDTTYIPADKAMLPANLHRVSQTRGVPILASALGVFERTDGYLESEQIAAQTASNLVYFIKRADPRFWVDENGNLPNWVVTETAADGTEQQLIKSEPGQIVTGDVGDQLELLNHQRPGETFEPYVTTMLRLIGAGIGMPLELVLLDFSKTNYSSARAALLQAYRTFMCWQKFVVDEMLNQVYQRWIGQAITDKELPLRGDMFNVHWLMPRWAWIDPLKEVLAADKAVGMGIDCLADHIETERQTLAGYVRRRKRELKAFAEAGIPTTTVTKGEVPSMPADEKGQDDE